MAILFLMLIVFGSAVQAQDHCHDRSTIDSGATQKESFQLNVQKAATAEHADETEATFHICHLGHCSFVLESIVSFFSISPKYLQVENPLFLLISDFHSNLYRPPIS